MPKMKTLSSAKKRFKIIGSGKIKRRKGGMRHLLSKKKSKKKRDLQRNVFLKGGQRETVREMLVI